MDKNGSVNQTREALTVYYYAQLDEDHVCVGVSSLSGEVEVAHMIRLTETEYLQNLLGWQYADGTWEAPKEVDQRNG